MSDPAVIAIVVTVFIWLIGLTAAGAYWAGGIAREQSTHKERLDSGSTKMAELTREQNALGKAFVGMESKIDMANSHLARIERQNKQIWDRIGGAVARREAA
jgi:TolA-binding protein